MKNTCIVLFALVFAVSVRGLDWPFSSFSIGAGFGTQVAGRLLPGVVMRAEELPVRASASGDVAFVEDAGVSACSLPSGLGSFIAVHHDESFTAVYAGLKPGTVSGYYKTIKKGDALGMAGASFFPDVNGMFFMLFDRERRQYVNPLLFLPEAPDTKAPIIRTVMLKRGNDIVNLASAKTLKQGEWQILAEINDDTGFTSGPAAPYRVRLLLNGNEKAFFQFDVIKEIDGFWSLFQNNPVPSRLAYQGDGRLLLASLPVSRGRLQLEVITSDFKGNERSAAWVLQVE